MKRYYAEHNYTTGMYLNFILLPLGSKLNVKLKGAVRGDRLCLNDATVIIDHVEVMPMRDIITDTLCRMKYGRAMATIKQIWINNAMALGAGPNAVDKRDCLAVFYANNKV